MHQSNIARIKNILEGNFTAKSSVSSGYKKQEEEHKEGDIWKDSSGKMFTKKNGIVRSYSKLSEIRQIIKEPLVCPECGNPMKTHQDNFMWKKFRKCFSCIINEDNQKIIDGTFNQYSENKIKQNTKSWLNDLEVACLEAVESIDSEAYITEMGDIEDWSKSKMSKEKLKENVIEQISELKEKLNI